MIKAVLAMAGIYLSNLVGLAVCGWTRVTILQAGTTVVQSVAKETGTIMMGPASIILAFAIYHSIGRLSSEWTFPRYNSEKQLKKLERTISYLVRMSMANKAEKSDISDSINYLDECFRTMSTMFAIHFAMVFSSLALDIISISILQSSPFKLCFCTAQACNLMNLLNIWSAVKYKTEGVKTQRDLLFPIIYMGLAFWHFLIIPYIVNSLI